MKNVCGFVLLSLAMLCSQWLFAVHGVEHFDAPEVQDCPLCLVPLDLHAPLPSLPSFQLSLVGEQEEPVTRLAAAVSAPSRSGHRARGPPLLG